MIKLAHSILIAVLFLQILSSCKKDKNPPDLLFDFATVGEPEVEVNVPLPLESSIENQPEGETLDAGDNNRAIRVQYRPDENSPWIDAQIIDQNGDTTYELVKPVPSLKPGSKHSKTEGFSFPLPGIYRYGLEVDLYNVVEERIEQNNEIASNDGQVRAPSNPAFQLTVKVKDPSGILQPVYGAEAKVAIKYLGEK